MLKVGLLAPDFNLPQAGGGRFNLLNSLKRGPVLLVFYKFNCPTCQFTFPFLERLAGHLTPFQNLSFYGVAQDSESEALKFKSDYGIDFDILYDDSPYPVSHLFDLKVVPSFYLIDETRKIAMAFESFDKKGIQSLGAQLVSRAAKSTFEIFNPTDQVPLLKPG